MARLQGDVYFVVNLHICMYLGGGWHPLTRISPHLDVMDLAVWQKGQLSDGDMQPTLCPHDGWARANTQLDQRWNPAAPWPVEEGPDRSVIMLFTYLMQGKKYIQNTILDDHWFWLCSITHSSPDIHALIHLKAEGRLSVPSCHQARLNVSQNVRQWEMAAHHVSIYRDTLPGVFAALFWRYWQSQGSASVLPHTPSINGMRRNTEKEKLCVGKRWRIKRNDMEERVKQRGEKGRGKEIPWGEKLSVPGRLQTYSSPVISLLPGSLLTAPWLRRLDSLVQTHTDTHFLATIRAPTLSELSAHTTTHSNSIDIRTLMLIFTLRVCICASPTCIFITTLNAAEVLLLQLCQRHHTHKLLLLIWQKKKKARCWKCEADVVVDDDLSKPLLLLCSDLRHP